MRCEIRGVSQQRGVAIVISLPLLSIALLLSAVIVWIPGPVHDHVVIADIHRGRMRPYHVFPTARSWGYDTACDSEYEDCPRPDPPIIFRKRYINGNKYCIHDDPTPGLNGPSEMGQFFLKRANPPASAPPKLHTKWWRPVRHCDLETMSVPTCQGWAPEKGRFFQGDVSVTRNRDGQGQALGPPKWRFYSNFTAELSDGGDGESWAKEVPDILEADMYRFLLLAPVPPASSWNPTPPFSVPYGEGAENEFCFNDVLSYKVPCFPRAEPYRYVGEQHPPVIPAGLRLIAGMSSGNPRLAQLSHYSYSPGCSFQFPYPVEPGRYMIEIFTRLFRAETAATRYVWTADPQERGWWVEYHVTLEARLAHNYSWVWSGVRGFPPDSGGFFALWNAWYEGKVTATIHGDTADPAFRQWIESQDSGYGVNFRPASSHCNDALKQCLDIDDAMGDVKCPADYVQDGCTSAGTTPCLAAGLGHSYWYAPEPPSNIGVPPSLHPVLGIPQYPSTGLIHAIEREMIGLDGEPTGEIQNGWATLYFSSVVPHVT